MNEGMEPAPSGIGRAAQPRPWLPLQHRAAPAPSLSAAAAERDAAKRVASPMSVAEPGASHEHELRRVRRHMTQLRRNAADDVTINGTIRHCPFRLFGTEVIGHTLAWSCERLIV